MSKVLEKSVISSTDSMRDDRRGRRMKPAKILVVDDEVSMRDYLSDLLLVEGYQVETVDNGETAIEKIKGDSFALVITDITMPGISGLELIHRAKSIDPEIDVVVMTGYSALESAVESMKSGAVDYITKPFNGEHVRIIIKKVLERRWLKQKAEEMDFYRQLAQTDGLTEVFNHRYFHQLLAFETSRARRYNQSLSLLMIDIDNFKEYNEFNGHPKGDLALKKVAWVLRHSVRSSDLIARYGGEEFTILVPHTDKVGAGVLARRLREKIEVTEFEGEEILPEKSLTVSIGVAGFPEDAETKEGLLKRVDHCLYKAKELGRNRVFISGVSEE